MTFRSDFPGSGEFGGFGGFASPGSMEVSAHHAPMLTVSMRRSLETLQSLQTLRNSQNWGPVGSLALGTAVST